MYYIIGHADFESLQKIKSNPDHFSKEVEIIYTHEYSINKILQLVEHADKESMVYYQHVFSDVNGEQFRPVEVAGRIYNISPVPLYTGYEHSIFGDCVGGFVKSTKRLGAQTALMSIDILELTIDTTTRSRGITTSEYIFDWAALKRFNIDERQLPDGSVIVNKKYSLWEMYWHYILVGLVLILLQSVLIVLLLRNRAVRRIAEQEVIDINHDFSKY